MKSFDWFCSVKMVFDAVLINSPINCILLYLYVQSYQVLVGILNEMADKELLGIRLFTDIRH